MAAINYKTLHGSSSSLFAPTPLTLKIPPLLSKGHAMKPVGGMEMQTDKYGIPGSLKPVARYSTAKVNKTPQNSMLLSVQPCSTYRNTSNDHKQLFATNQPAIKRGPSFSSASAPAGTPGRKLGPLVQPWNKSNNSVHFGTDQRLFRSMSLESNGTNGANSSNCNSEGEGGEEEDDEGDSLSDGISLSDILDLGMDDADCSDYLDIDLDLDTAFKFDRDEEYGGDSDTFSPLTNNLDPLDPEQIPNFSFNFSSPSDVSSPAACNPGEMIPVVPYVDSNPCSPYPVDALQQPSPLQNVPGSRPLSPAISTTSTNNHSTCSQASDVSLQVKTETLGQVNYQCSRCWIIYPALDEMEMHIGQFHMSVRSAEDAPFELTDDNIGTLVKLVWDANLTCNLYSGFMRKLPEAAASAQYPCSATLNQLSMTSSYPFAIGVNGEFNGLLDQEEEERIASPMDNSPILPGALMDMVLDMDVDSDCSSECESSWGSSATPSVCSQAPRVNLDTLIMTPEMRFELEMPARLPEPKILPLNDLDNFRIPSYYHPKKQTKRREQPPKKEKKKKEKTAASKASTKAKATLKDASRKVDEMMTVLDHFAKEKAEEKLLKQLKKKEKKLQAEAEALAALPLSGGEESFGSPGEGDESEEGKDGKLPPRVKGLKGKRSKSMRKCRGVYGINNQSSWCNMCKWKKRCNRFGEDEEGVEGEDLLLGVPDALPVPFDLEEEEME